MKQKTYTINPAKIGNQQGFRLPRVFYKENPQFIDNLLTSVDIEE